MIISHKYKFIFIKPAKVAGTSVEVAIAKHCGQQDIITNVENYSKKSDDDSYQNYAKNNKGFENHDTPKKIKKTISKEIWNNYYKFTIIRNPWDVAVSRFFWNNWWHKNRLKKRGGNILRKIIKNIFNIQAYLFFYEKHKNKKYINNIKYLLKHYKKEWANTDYYFDEKEKPICDFYIRYEDLEKDYRRVCEHLGIPSEKLPRLKTKQRTEKKHYSVYYDNKSRKRIAKICRREIEFFNYKFDHKK